MIEQCILGTAQLGMSYGIANSNGQPTQTTATAIVQTALQNGVIFFDTAQAYGTSEKVLGLALQCSAAAPRIVTKLAPELPETPKEIADSITLSLSRLGVQSLYGLMLHRQEQLPLLDGWLGEILHNTLKQGKAQHIGVSVYTPDAALAALESPLISVVQIPASLFDRRFEDAGVFDAAASAKKELHIRSIFLQGVLCMRPEQLPPALAGMRTPLEYLWTLANARGYTPAQCAISWMRVRYPQCRCIFGAESPVQVLQTLTYAQQASLLPHDLYVKLNEVFPPQSPELLNPALWVR